MLLKKLLDPKIRNFTKTIFWLFSVYRRVWKLFLTVKRLKKCFALEFSPKEGDKCEFHTSRGRLPGLKEDTLEEVKKDETGREGEVASQITNPISEEEESG